MGRILKFLVTIVLVIQVTDLFRFAMFFDIPLNLVGGASILVLYTYIFSQNKTLKPLARNIFFKTLFLLLIVIPILWSPYHYLSGYLSINSFMRHIFNNILYLGIFASLIFLILETSARYFSRLLSTITIVILFGIVMDYIFPGLFYALKLKVWGIEKEGFDFSTIEITRVGGFFLKSTGAASSLVFLLPSLLLVFGKQKVYRIFFYYFSIFFLILLTGSRSGILVLVLCFPIVSIGVMGIAKSFLKTNISNILGLGFLMAPVLLIFMAGLSYLGLSTFKPEIKNVLVDRISTLTSTDKVSNDVSVHHRTSAQLLYFDKILDNPFFGYGNEYSKRLRDRKDFRFSSHNSLIESTFMYGLINLLVFSFLIYTLIYTELKVTKQSLRLFLLFGTIVFMYSFFINTLLQNRVFFFTLAVLSGTSIKNIKLK